MDQKEIVHEYRDLCALAALLEPVDADHQRPVSDTLAEAAHVSGAIRAGRFAATGQTSILIGNTCARTVRPKACQTPRPSSSARAQRIK